MLRVKQIMGNGLKRFCKQAMRAWHEEAMVAKFLRTQSEFIRRTRPQACASALSSGSRSAKCDATAGSSPFVDFREWTCHLGLRKEDKRREEKLAIVLKQMMLGNMAKILPAGAHHPP